jgi:hypothetical protein
MIDCLLTAAFSISMKYLPHPDLSTRRDHAGDHFFTGSPAEALRIFCDILPRLLRTCTRKTSFTTPGSAQKRTCGRPLTRMIGRTPQTIRLRTCASPCLWGSERERKNLAVEDRYMYLTSLPPTFHLEAYNTPSTPTLPLVGLSSEDERRASDDEFIESDSDESSNAEKPYKLDDDSAKGSESESEDQGAGNDEDKEGGGEGSEG